MIANKGNGRPQFPVRIGKKGHPQFPKGEIKIKKKIHMIIIVLVIIAIILLGPLQMQKKIMKMLYPREYENFVKV